MRFLQRTANTFYYNTYLSLARHDRNCASVITQVRFHHIYLFALKENHNLSLVETSSQRSLTTSSSNSSSNISSAPSSDKTSSDASNAELEPTSFASNRSWSEEWKKIGLGAMLPNKTNAKITNLLFVQTGFGVDQHGDRKSDGATKAAARAVRNAIEFNAIPGVIEAVPGGRNEMLIQVLLGVPPKDGGDNEEEEGIDGSEKASVVPMDIDLEDVAKVFPYGQLLPIKVVVGGLKFPTGRIVSELGDEDDNAICVIASISIGYDNGKGGFHPDGKNHTTYNTKDGY